ncbi:hypothetical protein [Rhizorhabdus sp. FW153]|uniref:hypothetical protein n=1 Tax=Rhizorhabdus sp. FW153 TaxID=3400216 RepID=UPI003CEB8202
MSPTGATAELHAVPDRPFAPPFTHDRRRRAMEGIGCGKRLFFGHRSDTLPELGKILVKAGDLAASWAAGEMVH